MGSPAAGPQVTAEAVKMGRKSRPCLPGQDPAAGGLRDVGPSSSPQGTLGLRSQLRLICSSGDIWPWLTINFTRIKDV